MQVVLSKITKKNMSISTYISYFCIPFMAIKDKMIQMVENVKFVQRKGREEVTVDLIVRK